MQQNKLTEQHDVWRNIHARSSSHWGREKQITITYSECVFVALVIEHPKSMHRIILPSVARPILPHFSKLSHKRHDLLDEVTEHKMCVLIFSTASVWKISHSKKNSARYYYVCTYKRLHVKYPLFFKISVKSPNIFSKKKFSNIKFHENPTSRSRTVPCGRKDRHEEINSRFSKKICDRA